MRSFQSKTLCSIHHYTVLAEETRDTYFRNELLLLIAKLMLFLILEKMATKIQTEEIHIPLICLLPQEGLSFGIFPDSSHVWSFEYSVSSCFSLLSLLSLAWGLELNSVER